MPAGADLRELMDVVRTGGREGWDALVGRLAPLVWAVPRGHGLDSSASLEVAQTTWLRLIEHLPTLDGTSVQEWVVVTSRDESRRVLRWIGDDPRVLTTHELWRDVERLPLRCRLSVRVAVVDPAVG